jgi:glucosamine--fructose-6-phosphate aminotransferase (isomerizing)
MLSSYLGDILEQPAALHSTLEELKNMASLSSFARELTTGKYQRVILTGMGSSYHALYPLVLRLIERGLCAQTLETSELIHHAAALIEPRTLIVAVSQSGESAETVRLLEGAHQKTAVIGITNTPDSTLARQATAAVFTRAGQETSVSCKTYLATLAALCWLGDQLLGEPSLNQHSLLLNAPELVSRYLANWQRHVDILTRRLSGIRNLFLVGRGISLAAAGTGALIIKESARFPAEGMSSASFRHGPFEMVAPHVLVAAFAGSGETLALNIRLVEDIITAGGQAEVIQEGRTENPFDLPGSSIPLLPILEILPAQMISLALARIQGIEPGKFDHIRKVTTAE